jgi:hypothetical protein
MIWFTGKQQKNDKSNRLAGKIGECTNGIDALTYLKVNIFSAENLP